MNVAMDTLENGIRVVSVQMNGLATAAIGAFVGVGSRDEPQDLNGAAHFFEHMVFKGTPSRAAIDISSQIENLGADINAYTSHDITAYHAIGLDDVVVPGVEIIGDVLAHSNLASTDIDMERGVINQEIRRYADDPDSVVAQKLASLSFPGHAYGRPILGTPESLDHIDAAALRGFVDRRFGGKHLVVAAAGCVDHKVLVDAAHKAFGDMAVPGVERDLSLPQRKGGIDIVDTGRFEQVSMACSFAAPGKSQNGYEDFAVMAAALGGSMSSPLFQEIRVKRGLAYSVGSWYDGQQDFGQVCFSAGTSTLDAAELLQTMMDVIRNAGCRLDQACVARARNAVRVQLARTRESVFGTARIAASSLLRQGFVEDLVELEARVAAVDVERVQSAVNSMLGAQGAALAIVGPLSNPDHLEKMACAMFSA